MTDFEKSAAGQEPTPVPNPSPAAQPLQFQTPAKKPPIRRVGTLTMGFGLIAVGLIALVAIFNPGFDLTFVLKLSPLIFVFLGIETLVGYFRHKNERIRVDLLSGFVSFILICGALGLSILPTVWAMAGPPAQQAREVLQDDAEEEFYNALKQNQQIASADIRAYLPYTISFDEKTELDEVKPRANYHYYITLTGPFADGQAFSAACREILDGMEQLSVTPDRIEFCWAGKELRYDLALTDRFGFNKSAGQLAELVSSQEIYSEDNGWYTQEQMESYAQERVSQALAEQESAAMDELESVEALANTGDVLFSEDMWPDYVLMENDGMNTDALYFDLAVDAPTTLQLSTTTDSGRLDIEVTGPHGLAYSQTGIGSETHTFSLPSSGSYTFRLTADQHTGSIRITNLHT